MHSLLKPLLLSLFILLFSIESQARFLEADEAFKPSIALKDSAYINVTIELGKDIYLYKKSIKLKLKKSDGYALEMFSMPEAKLKDGEWVYHDKFSVDIPFSKKAGSSQIFTVVLEYQGCSGEGLCYQPITHTVTLKSKEDPSKKEVVQDSTSATNSSEPFVDETDIITQTLHSANLWIILFTFFGFGILLALTPCVFPMIPILSSIIISYGEKMNTRKAFMLSLVYVLSMAVAYTIAGVLAGLFGANLQALMQTPWVLWLFSGIFVILAISMFGFFDIQIPVWLQNRIDKRVQKTGGGYVGVALMGFFSALIVGPCVAAPLAGALIYIGQTGDAVIGGVALFSLSMGMGIPLLLVGITAGKYMPKPGPWMDNIKYIFGVTLLGVAIWLISRIVSAQITMLLWSLLLGFSSIYLGALEPLKEGAKGISKFSKALGLLLFFTALFIFIGAFTNATNPLDPLKNIIEKRALVSNSENGDTLNSNSGEDKLFLQVSNLEELLAIVEQNSGKKIMLDFYADWCVSCKEMEEYVFSAPEVREVMKSFLLIQADITENTKEHNDLLRHFNLYGPPGIIFFNEQGKEIRKARIIGDMEKSDFFNHLIKVRSY